MTTAGKIQIPCFLCGKYVLVKDTKRDKPYFICDDCGLQVFIRCKPGIIRFNRLLGQYRNRPGTFVDQDQRIYRYLQILSRISELEKRREDIEDSQSLVDFFSSDSHKEQAIKNIKREINNAKSQLRNMGDL